MAKFISKFTGEEIDRRLEDVDKKAGLFYYDSTNNRYLVFTNESARDEYLEDKSKVELIIGTFDAPFNYSAKIVLESKAYNAVSLGSTGHFLDFTFDIENKNGQSTGENVICTYTFRRGSVKQTVVEQYAAGRSVHFNIDKYLSEGTNNLINEMPDTFTISPDRILYRLGIEKKQAVQQSFLEENKGEENVILKALAEKELSFDELCDKTGMKPAEISSELIRLEMFGLIKKGSGNIYYKI